jgi:hypothetical protein
MAVMGLTVWCTPHFVGEQIYKWTRKPRIPIAHDLPIYQRVNRWLYESTDGRSYSVLSTENPCGVR